MGGSGATSRARISPTERRFALLGWGFGAVLAVSLYAGLLAFAPAHSDTAVAIQESGDAVAAASPIVVASAENEDADWLIEQTASALAEALSDITRLEERLFEVEADLQAARAGQTVIAQRIDGVENLVAQSGGMDGETSAQRDADPTQQVVPRAEAQPAEETEARAVEAEPASTDTALTFEPAYSPPAPRVILAAPITQQGSPRRIAAELENQSDPVAISRRPMPDPDDAELARAVDDLALEIISGGDNTTLPDGVMGGQLLPPRLANTRAQAAARAQDIVEPAEQEIAMAGADELITGSIVADEPLEADIAELDAVISHTPFGLDLGGVGTLEEIDRLWRSHQERFASVLGPLVPRIMLRQTPDGALDLRLVAGPIEDAADAALACARLRAAGASDCLPSIYDGQLLSQR